MPHSKPSRTSEASSLKRRKDAMLPSQVTTPSRIKRARALRFIIPSTTMQPDHAHSWDSEGFAHIGFAENLFFLDFLEHADHGGLNLFFDLVDDRVQPDVHVLLFRKIA